MRNTIYVGNLRYNITESDLKRLFSKFGEVLWAKMLPNDKGGTKGVAFVEMANSEQIQKAIRVMNGKELGGRTLKVSEANNRFANETKYKKIDKQIQKESKPNREKRSGLAVLKRNTGK